MRAVGYIRVSTEEQTESGISLEAQKERIEAFAKAKGWDLLEVISDPGCSAKNLKRFGSQKIISLCKRRLIDVLIVTKLDRLTRHVADLGYLTRDVFTKNRVGLVSVVESIDTTTAAGQLMLNVLGAVAQWERDAIAERTKEALAHKRRKGELIGAVPFGYDLNRDGKSLTKNENEQKIIDLILNLRSQQFSYRKIALLLNEKGVPAKKGGCFYPKTVRSVVKSMTSNRGKSVLLNIDQV